ncbi:VirB3 family type IV secretion system protein [Salmonella enterica]|nr:VirB3 family type IV secretion system protein [Salmonella enterica]EKI2475200.1 VirB3 family type IV secretion system protein [Salmonella enterica]EMB7587767.1 VirB3 family type IV secretion system protein [Salmonella enterica]
MEHGKENPLKNKTVFFRRRTKFGVPAVLVAPVLLLAAFLVFAAISQKSVLFGLLALIFIITTGTIFKFIFKDDPQAHISWLIGFQLGNRLTYRSYNKRNIRIL